MAEEQTVHFVEGVQPVEVLAKKSKAHRSRRGGVKRQIAARRQAKAIMKATTMICQTDLIEGVHTANDRDQVDRNWNNEGPSMVATIQSAERGLKFYYSVFFILKYTVT